MIELDLILLVGSVVVMVAILSARLGTRVGLPALLLFLGVGMLLGETRINFDNPDLAHALGFAALVIILAEGGLTTKWSDIRPSVGIAGVLATVGIGISVGLMASVRSLRPGPGLVDRHPARRGRVTDRRSRGVLGAAQRAATAASCAEWSRRNPV